MSKVILKKSSVAAKTPLTTDLDYGELAINYADGIIYYKKADNTIGKFIATTISGSYARTTFTATASQTTFSVPYTVGFLQVYLNGILLGTTDYIATDGTSVVLSVGATANDIVEVVAYNTLAIDTGTFTDLTVNGTGVISANSPSAALRITQTGSGNALLVEDSANPDSTPFVIDASGYVVSGHTAFDSMWYTSSNVPRVWAIDNMTNRGGFGSINYNGPAGVSLFRANGGVIGTEATVVSGDTLGVVTFAGYDGASSGAVPAAFISTLVDAAPSTGSMPGRLVFSTTTAGSNTPTERMRIGSDGNIGIGQANSAGYKLLIAGNLTGASTHYGVSSQGTFQSDVTVSARMFRSYTSTAASAFTLTSLHGLTADQGTFGAGSIVTNQFGISAGSSLAGATNTYGIYSAVASIPAGGTATSSVSTVSSSGTTVTITTAAAHGLSTNQLVTVPLTAAATALVSGVTCTILTVGTTDYTLIGAASNTAGVSFTATGTGSGTGTVTLNQQGSARTITVVDTTNFTYTAASSATFTAITATGTITPNTRFNIYSTGTAPNYFAGAIGIGLVPSINANYNLYITKNITGGTTSYGMVSTSTIQSDVTTTAYGNISQLNTVATTFNLANLRHFWVNQGTIGAGSTITTQIGYGVDNTLTAATTNYGFYGNITAGTGRWNFYANGTADNYFAGRLGIGSSALTTYGLRIGVNTTGGTTAYSAAAISTVQSDVTSNAGMFYSLPSTAAASFTVSNLYHYNATQGTIGAGSTISNQYGFFVNSNMTGATNNYGFYSNIASGTGDYNFYAAGTADNYFAGNVLIGITSGSSKLTVAGIIESTSGGIKFPDGTTQITAPSAGFSNAKAYFFKG